MNDNDDIHTIEPRRDGGKWCDKCGRRIMLVQAGDGERFYVTTFTGERHCRG